MSKRERVVPGECRGFAQTLSVAVLAFSLPAGQSLRGKGVTPQGQGQRESEWRNVIGMRRLWLFLLGCPTTRLMLRGLAVMAWLAQWPKVLRCIRVRFMPCLQLLSTQRPMVGDDCRSTAQHTPRIRVQIRLALPLPANVIATLTRASSLLLTLFRVFRAWAAIGQLTASWLAAWRSGFPWHTCTPGEG